MINKLYAMLESTRISANPDKNDFRKKGNPKQIQISNTFAPSALDIAMLILFCLATKMEVKHSGNEVPIDKKVIPITLVDICKQFAIL